MLYGIKPAAQSRTIQAAAGALIIALWAPLCLAVGALLTLVGVHVDTQAWAGFASDQVISGAEWLSILRDVVIAGLAWLAIRFRATATNKIGALTGRDVL